MRSVGAVFSTAFFFALADFAAALLVAAGFAFAAGASGVLEPPFVSARAIASISSTLPGLALVVLAAGADGADDSGADGAAEVDAGSLASTASEPPPPPSIFRAAAKISATDNFFSSAIFKLPAMTQPAG
jgi:hypothetical protein